MKRPEKKPDLDITYTPLEALHSDRIKSEAVAQSYINGYNHAIEDYESFIRLTKELKRVYPLPKWEVCPIIKKDTFYIMKQKPCEICPYENECKYSNKHKELSNEIHP